MTKENTTRKRLFLLDAYALIYRGYYAFIRNPRINSKGMNTSAIYGFVNTLLDIIRKEKPDLLAVVFDKGGSEIREAKFEEYKANRLEQPEAIEIAIPYIKRILEAMHIPILEKEGWEADDLIGTLAKQAAEKGYEVYIVTADKDFGQIVSESIKIYRPSGTGGGYEIWDIEKVKEKFGVEKPGQVIDFLAMTGDSVDNVPGIPGVGEKTAKKFIAEFGSLENLYQNTDKLKGKLKEKVESAKDLAFLSKELVTIHTDAPVEFHEEDFHLSEPDSDKVLEIFKELEFRRLADQFKEMNGLKEKTMEAGTPYSLFGDEPAPSQTKQDKTGPFIQEIKTPKGLELLKEKLQQSENFSISFYPATFDFVQPVQYISIAIHPDLIYFIPLGEINQTEQEWIHFYKEIWTDPKKSLTGFDLKEWIKLLLHHHLEPEIRLWDLMIMHYLINPDMRHDLRSMAQNYLHTDLPSLPKQPNRESIKNFLGKQTSVMLQLKDLLISKLKEIKALELYEKIEEPLIKVLARMELNGVKIDTKALEELSKEIDEELQKLEKEIYALAGEEFNIASPKQLGKILFEKLKIDSKPKKTKTGQYSTSEDTLTKYKFKHPIVGKILEWRQLQKLKNTYIDALPKQIHPKTGKIHTHFNQAITATGRLSSTNPNLQNIPIRTPKGRLIRKAFVPSRKNHKIVAADYSQIELRLIAEMSQDPAMLESFKKGEDIHRATAAKLFKVPLEEVTRDQRSQAKTVNFGIIYGVSAHGLSQQTGLSRTEAKKLIDAYFETYPKLKEYIQKQIEFAREHGYVETIMGRRRYLPDIHSRNAVVRGAAERNAINAPIQGSAADIIKKAMIQIDKRLREENMKTKMLLQVHDELVFEVPEDELEKAEEIIRQEMENAVHLSIPLTADIHAADNWLDAH